MSGSIKLHPVHGVNPSVFKCFWCGKDQGVALLGFNKDRKAPREMVLDYNPCDECRAKFEMGIALIEASDQPILNSKQPPIQTSPVTVYPTGNYAVITEDGLRRLIHPADLVEEIIKKRKAFVEPGFLKAIGIGESGDGKPS